MLFYREAFLVLGLIIRRGLVALLLTGFSLPMTHANDLSDVLFKGSTKFAFQLRFQDVNALVRQDVSAVTFRTRLSYQTKPYRGFYTLLGLEDTRVIGGLDGKYSQIQSGFATVGDPRTTEINKALIDFSGFPRDRLTLGRQALNFDAGRFVGNQPWFQNEQTFDALVIRNRLFKQVPVTYAFINKVRDSNALITSVSDQVFHARYTHPQYGNMSVYGLFLSDDVTAEKSNTLGLRLALKQPVNVRQGLETSYVLEAASQKAGDKHVNFIAINAGLRISGLKMALGYEVLGSDRGSYGFQTPLGSTHDFNGWSDVFEVTPVTGLRDVSLSLSENAWRGMDMLATYHRFFAAYQRIVYGAEVDLRIAKVFDAHNSVGFKYATYSSRRFVIAPSNSKWWLWFKFES